MPNSATPEPSADLLKVRNLVVEFPSSDGRITAVNDVNFTIKSGEIVALVGESGSGKSATALSLMRLLEQSGGFIAGGSAQLHLPSGTVDLFTASPSTLRKLRGSAMSMVFQEPMTSLNPALTCGEQVDEVTRTHLGLSRKDARANTIALFAQVGIDQPEEAYQKFPHQLSGGQKQRVLIASAIAANPRLLIADEPTTALDAGVKRRINQLLRTIQRERRLSMLYITHDMDSVEDLADYVMVMYAGKVVEKGPTAKVLSEPQHPYTKGLLACRPPKTGRYYFLPTINDFMRISADGTDIEQSAQVEDVFRNLIISPDERVAQLDRLYREQPILKAEHIRKSYKRPTGWKRALMGQEDRFAAVHDVSFNLFKGETLGLVGASGCGKTTLGRCIVGLTTPDAGSVYLRQRYENMYHPVPPLREVGSRIQYIFQDPYASLNPRQTIAQALMEPLLVRAIGSEKSRRETVLEMLVKVGLKPFHLNRYPDEFSGGQRQRIAIARALLLEPEIIVCDEAVSALDVSVQAQVLNLLNELKYEYGLSYLFISHDLHVVRYMCDRVLVMHDGRIVEEGESDNLFANPKEAYTASLIR